jgi:hypothetical protein
VPPWRIHMWGSGTDACVCGLSFLWCGSISGGLVMLAHETALIDPSLPGRQGVTKSSFSRTVLEKQATEGEGPVGER